MSTRKQTGISKARLTEMAREATVDAHDEAEQTTGWFTMFEEHLPLPFNTTVLDVDVVVTGVDLRDGNQIVAICKRGRIRQAISIVDLPLPSTPPPGMEWIEAYRAWLKGT